jgi:RNA polymerase subunit RPABC4/transcription elongation factor Spt4
VAEEKMTKVNAKCPVCGVTDEFQIPDSGLVARAKGVLLSRAFPDLSNARIVQLATHVCPGCQAKA